MTKKILVNGLELSVEDYRENRIDDRLKVSFTFQVTSEAYHDVTTLLYKNDFQVEVPEKNLKFRAVIHKYSTSITNLYEKDKVGEFSLELIEKG